MDETFIKMCKEAKEIQEGWKPKDGDRLINNGNKSHPSFVFTILRENVTWDDKYPHQERFSWLPRQEDLQKIILDGFEGEHENYKPTPTMVLKTFARDFVNQFGNDLDDRRSLNELWLIFVMETCFNKRWNGETWEPIGE